MLPISIQRFRVVVEIVPLCIVMLSVDSCNRNFYVKRWLEKTDLTIHFRRLWKEKVSILVLRQHGSFDQGYHEDGRHHQGLDVVHLVNHSSPFDCLLDLSFSLRVLLLHIHAIKTKLCQDGEIIQKSPNLWLCSNPSPFRFIYHLIHVPMPLEQGVPIWKARQN